MPHSAETWGQWIVLVAAVLGAASVIWRMAIRPVVHGVDVIAEKMADLAELLQPDEDGLSIPKRLARMELAMASAAVEARSLKEDVAAMATELAPNNGEHLRDQVDSLMGRLDELWEYSHKFKHDMLGEQGTYTLQRDTLQRIVTDMNELRKQLREEVERSVESRTRSTDT